MEQNTGMLHTQKQQLVECFERGNNNNNFQMNEMLKEVAEGNVTTPLLQET